MFKLLQRPKDEPDPRDQARYSNASRQRTNRLRSGTTRQKVYCLLNQSQIETKLTQTSDFSHRFDNVFMYLETHTPPVFTGIEAYLLFFHLYFST